MSEPAILYRTKRVRPLAEVSASDIPRGLTAEDVATDCDPDRPVVEPEPAPPSET